MSLKYAEDLFIFTAGVLNSTLKLLHNRRLKVLINVVRGKHYLSTIGLLNNYYYSVN